MQDGILTSKYQWDSLTEREGEVVRMLAGVKTPKDIAAKLEISVFTVRAHIRHILKKLGLHSVLEVVAAAYLDHFVEVTRS